MNTLTDLIYQKVQRLPSEAAYEILKFIEFVEFKQQHLMSTSDDNHSEFLKFIQELPKGSREVADIDKDLQTLRNEWGKA